MALPFVSQRAGRALIFGALALATALIALSAAGALRQSVSLSLSSGILTPTFLLTLVPFAIWSYGLRVIRWHTLLQRLVPGLPLRISGYTQVVGFAFSATPGRVAELYKLKLLERSTSIPIAESLPAALVERLTDIVAFGLLVVVGGILDWSDAGGNDAARRWVMIGAGLVILTLAYQAGRRTGAFSGGGQAIRTVWLPRAMRYLRIVPGISRFSAIAIQLRAGGSRITNPYTLTLALLCVTIGRLGDGFILWQISRSVGYPVSFSLALLMIGSAGLVGGITLSPGGLGAAEATLVGLVMTRGAPLGVAMVTAFGARAMIFWIWVMLGLVVFVVTHGHRLIRRPEAPVPARVRVTAGTESPTTSRSIESRSAQSVDGDSRAVADLTVGKERL